MHVQIHINVPMEYANTIKILTPTQCRWGNCDTLIYNSFLTLFGRKEKNAMKWERKRSVPFEQLYLRLTFIETLSCRSSLSFLCEKGILPHILTHFSEVDSGYNENPVSCVCYFWKEKGLKATLYLCVSLTVCKSCILNYLERKNNYCPICEVQLNEAKPHLSLRYVNFF